VLPDCNALAFAGPAHNKIGGTAIQSLCRKHTYLEVLQQSLFYPVLLSSLAWHQPLW